MGKITVDDLYKWMYKYEEDPIADGPHWFKKEEEFQDFLTNFSEKELKEILRMSCKKDISDLDINDFGIGGGCDFEHKIAKVFVDTLNKYNYPNEY